MKITESFLRRVIREEFSLLKEKAEKYPEGDKEKIRRRVQDPYEYQVQDGKWYARKRGSTKWRDISKYSSAVDKLNKDFPADIKNSLNKEKQEKPEEEKTDGTQETKPTKKEKSGEPVKTDVLWSKAGKEFPKGLTLAKLMPESGFMSQKGSQTGWKDKRQPGDDIAAVILRYKTKEGAPKLKWPIKKDQLERVMIRFGRKGIFKVSKDLDAQAKKGEITDDIMKLLERVLAKKK